MNQLVISCSLSATSRSALLAGRLRDTIAELGDEVELIDLRQLELPFCNAGDCYDHANVARLKLAIGQAWGVTIATPIHNFETGGVTRNLISLTGDSWTNKVVGFVCAAGGQGAYMAVMSLANSLMLDFRSVIVPRFVYATGAAFKEDVLVDDGVAERIVGLAAELHRFGSSLATPAS